MGGTRFILIALVVGIATGLAIRASGSASLIQAGGAIRPIGALWLAGLRMTLVPLVFAMVAQGIGSFARSGERTIGIAVIVFGILLAIGVIAGEMLTLLLLHIWPIPDHAMVGLAIVPEQAHPAAPAFVDQIVALIPVNPVAAAAQGEMTPLIVFALMFGFAIARITPLRRDSLLDVLAGVADAMMAIVGWLIRIAPIGVFVLALEMSLDAGIAVARLLLQATLLTTAIVILGIGFCYVVARFGGGVGFRRFAIAVAGPQAVAAGTTSSAASLPALIEAAETGLHLPRNLVGAVLPLAVSTFRFGNVVLIGSTVMFAARAGGIEPSLGQIAIVAGVVMLSNIGVMGLPAAAVLYAAEAPAFQAIGAPMEFLPLMIATSALPDIVDTMCNVTAHLAATTVVARWAARRSGWSEPEAPPAAALI